MHQGSSNTILIVDDNLGARRSIEALLAHEPYRILLAETGVEAIAMARKHAPDLILLDVMMPEMSGFEVCQRIREDRNLSEIPIILITALDDDESMIQGIDAGADDFLPKPISRIELRSRVRGILRLNRFRKLCDERQKFEFVVTQSQFGYIVLDGDFRISFANPSARKFLNLKDTSPEGPRSFFDIAKDRYSFQPKNVPEIVSDPANPRRRDPFILVQSRSAAQGAKWIRASIQELGHDSRDQLLIKLEDITENIVSFQEKHTFSRMISHKLLTPLNALKAADQIMGDLDLGPEAKASVDQVLELQKRGIDRLEYDIQSILSFLESTSSTSTVASSTTVAETLSRLMQVAKNSDIHCHAECSGEVDERARIGISIHSFEACVREFIENTIKFKSKASPRIECRITSTGDPAHLSYLFSNNSNPFTEEELSNAWKPYWQADRYFTGEIQGMGLGLSLIATHVWTAGGACAIANRENEDGVQLALSFPLIAREQLA